jgi:hypothetical protein
MVNIGTHNIQTQATDAPGIAGSLREAFDRQHQVTRLDYGMA